LNPRTLPAALAAFLLLLAAQEAADLIAALRGKAASRSKGPSIPATHP